MVELMVTVTSTADMAARGDVWDRTSFGHRHHCVYFPRNSSDWHGEY